MQRAAVNGVDLPTLVTEAMTAIEDDCEPLIEVLPRDYGIFVGLEGVTSGNLQRAKGLVIGVNLS